MRIIFKSIISFIETILGLFKRDKRSALASEITIEIIEIQSELTAGDVLEVDASVTNKGEDSGKGEINLSFRGDIVDKKEIELAKDQSSNIEFSYQIPINTPVNEEYEVKVSSSDDSDLELVLVLPAEQSITIEGNIEIKHNFRDSKVTQYSTESITESISQNNISSNEIESIPNEYIVKYKEGDLSKIKEKYDVIDTLESFNYALIKIPEVSALGVDDNILSFEENKTAYLDDYVYPSVSRFEEQWDKFAMRLPQAWRATTGDIDAIRPTPDSVRVAIIDTGIYAEHRELGNFVNTDDGWDFAEHNSTTPDYHGHGTHVAGIVAANNQHEIAGTMWQAELIPVKIFSDSFGVESFVIGKAMAYSAGYVVDGQQIEPVDVLNMSVSGGDTSYMQDISKTIYQDTNVIMVTSAGNNGTDGLTYPAKYPEIIAVGSLRNRGEDREPVRSNFSSIGPELDIVAPGSFILSLANSEDSLSKKSGTSMASPNLVGVVGLMLANGINPADVEDILYRTAIDLGDEGWNEEYGHGMVNAYWAVNAVDKIHISLGDYSQTVNLDAKEYTFEGIPYGEYTIEAWIDVRGNGIENGDYIFSKEVIIDENTTIDIILEELYQ